MAYKSYEENRYRSQVQVIEKDDPRYSRMLLMTGKSAPDRLYCIGNVSLLNRLSAGVVGARKATPYGKWAAYSTGRKLGEYGVVTVSGLAYGCDAEAHRGALSAGGSTIAVLGSGAAVCYPKKNWPLYCDIIENDGLIVSEQPPDAPPLRAYFAERNRIISGLSSVVVVTEAGLSSGSLITANDAAEQGRTVMAVPGSMNSISSIGCNKLIQDGAAIVVSLADVLDELGIRADPGDEASLAGLSDDEKLVFGIIRKNGELSANQIARETGRNISEINSAAARLEIKGFVVSSMGKVFIAK